MKKFFISLLDELKIFVSGKDKPVQDKPIISPQVITTVEKALAKRSAVHIIYQDSDFTGHILKFDQNKEQLVVENFKGSITMMIHLKEIKKVSILPISRDRDKTI
ncbi:hypothetical protein ABID29_002015 [Streptococcus rupicaprae]|uniref:YolD-like protein n=1 Tax=Streptococcus rupicaprae TaxID=759619 RepID=A0ABV2FK21_9STRE